MELSQRSLTFDQVNERQPNSLTSDYHSEGQELAGSPVISADAEDLVSCFDERDSLSESDLARSQRIGSQPPALSIWQRPDTDGSQQSDSDCSPASSASARDLATSSSDVSETEVARAVASGRQQKSAERFDRREQLHQNSSQSRLTRRRRLRKRRRDIPASRVLDTRRNVQKMSPRFCSSSDHLETSCMSGEQPYGHLRRCSSEYITPSKVMASSRDLVSSAVDLVTCDRHLYQQQRSLPSTLRRQKCSTAYSSAFDRWNSQRSLVSPAVAPGRKRKGCAESPICLGHHGSWESVVNRENFWESLRPDYQYLMDDALVNMCKEVNVEMTWDCGDVPELAADWTFDDFLREYNQLMHWLNSVHSAIYASAHSLTDRKLCQTLADQMHSCRVQRQLFVERGARLTGARAEVDWRQRHLCGKWSKLERRLSTILSSTTNITSANAANHPQSLDVRHEINELERRFQLIERELGPLTCRLRFSCVEQVNDKLAYHQALRDDVKSQRQIVDSLSQLAARGGASDSQELHQLCCSLHQHWLQLYLRAIEWVYLLETFQLQWQEDSQSGGACVNDCVSLEHTAEPLNKVLRLESDSDSAQQDWPVEEETCTTDCAVTNCFHQGGFFIEDDYLPPSLTNMQDPIVNSASSQSLTLQLFPEEEEERQEGQNQSNLTGSESFGVSCASDSSTYGSDVVDGLPRAAVNTHNVRCETITQPGSNDPDSNTSPTFSDGKHDEVMLNTSGPLCSAITPSSSSCLVSSSRLRRQLSPNDTGQQFCSSQRSSDNCATFYFKHDSDVETDGGTQDASTVADLRDCPNNSIPLVLESAETVEDTIANDNSPVVKECSGDITLTQDHSSSTSPTKISVNGEILRLVEQADCMIRQQHHQQQQHQDGENVSPRQRSRGARHKLARARRRRALNGSGLNGSQVIDQGCEASGETTTADDSDDMDAFNSTTTNSDELGSSDVITGHEVTTFTSPSVGSSMTVSPDAVSTPVKVRPLSGRRHRAQRPWSLHVPTARASGRIASLSVSETALHQLHGGGGGGGTPGGGVAGARAACITSSSSNATLSAGTVCCCRRDGRAQTETADSPPRCVWGAGLRRRSHWRRPITAALSSGSEGAASQAGFHGNRRQRRGSVRSLTNQLAFSTSPDPGHVIKSGSFNCAASLRNESDLPTTPADVIDSDSQSARSETDSVRDVTRDVTTTEEVSSLSEQAWDSYQEFKPITELGSDGSLDTDSVLRLLDCDDYRKYLDSQSEDCTTTTTTTARTTAITTTGGVSLSPPPVNNHAINPVSALRLRKKARVQSVCDQETCHVRRLTELLANTSNRLRCAENALKNDRADASATYCELVSVCADEMSRIDGIVSRCVTSVCSRHRNIRPGLSSRLQGVMERWRGLYDDATVLQQRHELHSRISRLRDRLSSLDSDVQYCAGATSTSSSTSSGSGVLDQLKSLDQVGARIGEHKELETRLGVCRSELSSLNADIHRHVVFTSSLRHQDVNNYDTSTFKDDITSLYRVIDQISSRLEESGQSLRAVESVWQQLATLQQQLATALQQDRRRLATLHDNLAAETNAAQLSSEARHLCHLLTTDEAEMSPADLDAADLAQPSCNASTVITSLQHGHHDSINIIDHQFPCSSSSSSSSSGYDSACSADDTAGRCWRMRRLRRLAHKLQSLLPASCDAWLHVRQSVAETGRDLHELQVSCHQLLAKSSVISPSSSSCDDHLMKRASVVENDERVTEGVSARRGGGERWRRVWRVCCLLQLPLLLCVWTAVCLLPAPQCCDSSSVNGGRTLALLPQLRHLSGPPPL